MNNIESNTGEIVMYQPDETIRLEVKTEKYMVTTKKCSKHLDLTVSAELLRIFELHSTLRISYRINCDN